MSGVFEKDRGNVIRCNENCAMRSEKENSCRIMQDEVCFNASGCSFHQTEEERQASREKFNQRMKSLSRDEQVYYAGKYYRGRMPWNVR
ncbi:MAG: hypothetical protein LUD12_10480 [Lachnospiraceae bacterium]|nr:hypothetical protein [Lachnospiraceae bacterium]